MAVEVLQLFQSLVSFDSKQRERIHKWIKNKINYDEERKGYPYSFDKDVSFHGCRLGPVQHKQPLFQKLYYDAALDQSLTNQLEKCHSLNWCINLVRLNAVTVPQDGNSLLHAASFAIWGVPDEHLTLRELLLEAMIVNRNESYKHRWWRQKLLDLNTLKDGSKIITKEWEEVVRSISSLNKANMSMSTPSEFLESVHIYVLSNILRRPIVIVTGWEVLPSGGGGSSREDGHIAGVYLPLEWLPIKCHKSPLILGYNLGKFCPLLSEVTWRPNMKELLFPLVTSDFCSLSVRFLSCHEEHRASELIQSYFIVKEVNVPIGASGEAFVPCAVLDYRDLPADMNIVAEHLQVCEQQAREWLAQVGGAHGENETKLLQQLHINSQTKVAPMRTFNESYQMSLRNQGTKEKLHSDRDSSKANQAVEGHQPVQRCILRGCERQGNASKGNLCDRCWEQLQVVGPTGEAMTTPQHPQTSTNHGERACSGFDVTVTEPTVYAVPTAPPASRLNSIEEPESMLDERCHNKCGYRCSTKTFPFCHECFNLVQGNQGAPPTSRALNNREGLSFLGVAPFNVNDTNQTQGNLMLFSPSPTHSLNNPLAGSNGRTQEARANRIDDEHNKLPERTFSQLESNMLGRTKLANDLTVKEHAISQRVEEVVGPVPDQKLSGSMAQSTIAMSERRQEGEDENVIFISSEPSICVSPFCHETVSSPNKLCDQCQAVLRRAQREQKAEPVAKVTPGMATSETGEKLQLEKLQKIQSGHKDNRTFQATQQQKIRARQRGKLCVSPGCFNYGDPVNADMCSSCYNKFALKEYEQLRREHTRSRTEKNAGTGQLGIAHHSLSQKEAAKPVKANTVNLPVSAFATSKTSVGPGPRGSMHGSLENFPTCDINAFNEGFVNEYEKFRDQSSSGLKKCKVTGCPNYGNASKGGYCNSCSAKIERQRREERIARFGENVLDGCSTQQNSI